MPGLETILSGSRISSFQICRINFLFNLSEFSNIKTKIYLWEALLATTRRSQARLVQKLMLTSKRVSVSFESSIWHILYVQNAFMLCLNMTSLFLLCLWETRNRIKNYLLHAQYLRMPLKYRFRTRSVSFLFRSQFDILNAPPLRFCYYYTYYVFKYLKARTRIRPCAVVFNNAKIGFAFAVWKLL